MKSVKQKQLERTNMLVMDNQNNGKMTTVNLINNTSENYINHKVRKGTELEQLKIQKKSTQHFQGVLKKKYRV